MLGSKKEGRLYVNYEGRYALDDLTYFTCGSSIEIFFNGSWLNTTIEHDSKQYYAVGLKGISLAGLLARVPEDH